MPVSLRGIVAGVALAGTAAGLAYTAIAIARTRAFRRLGTARGADVAPPLSILKPLHGAEPRLYENLRSFCEQDYPEFQVIFCSADPDDAALECARRLQQEFPDREIEIVAGRAHDALNPKIGNLLGAVDHAKHSVLVFADSDIHVGPGYLRAVAACFADPEVGAATCLYGGVPDESLSSRLGAMFVNDQFSPSALVATAIEPLTYCFGATMAVRAGVLERIGGLAALADHLGDDFRLGNLVSRAGFRIALAPFTVQTTVHEPDFKSLWLHELRWARTIRAQRPSGYAGSIVTYPLPFALLFAAAAPSRLAGGLAVALAVLLRAILHEEARKTFAPEVRARPWLIPVRDFLGVGVWCAGLSGRRVAWRDHAYAVNADGRLLASPGTM